MTDILRELTETVAEQSVGPDFSAEHWSDLAKRAMAEIERLKAALKDMKERVETSWERRDLAPDSDLEAVGAANKLLGLNQQLASDK